MQLCYVKAAAVVPDVGRCQSKVHTWNLPFMTQNRYGKLRWQCLVGVACPVHLTEAHRYGVPLRIKLLKIYGMSVAIAEQGEHRVSSAEIRLSWRERADEMNLVNASTCRPTSRMFTLSVQAAFLTRYIFLEISTSMATLVCYRVVFPWGTRGWGLPCSQNMSCDLVVHLVRIHKDCTGMHQSKIFRADFDEWCQGFGLHIHGGDCHIKCLCGKTAVSKTFLSWTWATRELCYKKAAHQSFMSSVEM